jgi:hypothetical protein
MTPRKLPLWYQCQGCRVWHELPSGWPLDRDLREVPSEYATYVAPCGCVINPDNFCVGVAFRSSCAQQNKSPVTAGRTTASASCTAR